MATRIPSKHGKIRCVLLLSAALFLVGLVAGASAQTTPSPKPAATQRPITLPPAAQAPATKPATMLPAAAQAPATAQPGTTQPPAAQAAGQTPGAATADAPVASAGGLCQCIGDEKALKFSCPGSADACQAQCGARFSFKPDATCPGAAQ